MVEMLANDGRLAIGFCLDESSSMGSVRDATISGFNEWVDELRQQPGKTSMTVTKFSSHTETTFRTLCENAQLKSVPKLTRENYTPQGNTPLFDAIAHTIEKMEGWLNEQQQNWTVLFVIQTDGEENSSRQHVRAEIFDMIQAKEKEGWRFIYLGADQDSFDAERIGTSMGMTVGSTMSYASSTTDSTYTGLAASTSMLRTAGSVAMSSADVAEAVKKAHDEEEKKKN